MKKNYVLVTGRNLHRIGKDIVVWTEKDEKRENEKKNQEVCAFLDSTDPEIMNRSTRSKWWGAVIERTYVLLTRTDKSDRHLGEKQVGKSSWSQNMPVKDKVGEIHARSRSDSPSSVYGGWRPAPEKWTCAHSCWCSALRLWSSVTPAPRTPAQQWPLTRGLSSAWSLMVFIGGWNVALSAF